MTDSNPTLFCLNVLKYSIIAQPKLNTEPRGWKSRSNGKLLLLVVVVVLYAVDKRVDAKIEPHRARNVTYVM